MAEPSGRSPIKLAITPHFQRRSKRLSSPEQRALARALRLFAANPQDPRLAPHKLRGTHEGQWSFSFGYDARVVFMWEGSTAVLLDVGSHDEVYG